MPQGGWAIWLSGKYWAIRPLLLQRRHAMCEYVIETLGYVIDMYIVEIPFGIAQNQHCDF